MKGSLLAHMLDPYLMNKSFSCSVNHLFLLSLLAGFSYLSVLLDDVTRTVPFDSGELTPFT